MVKREVSKQMSDLNKGRIGLSDYERLDNLIFKLKSNEFNISQRILLALYKFPNNGFRPAGDFKKFFKKMFPDYGVNWVTKGNRDYVEGEIYHRMTEFKILGLVKKDGNKSYYFKDEERIKKYIKKMFPRNSHFQYLNNKVSDIIKFNDDFVRNPSIVNEVKKEFNYKCFFNVNHNTFIGLNNNLPHVKAHHAISLFSGYLPPEELDVKENIIPLCGNCHDIIHWGLPEVKLPILNKIWKSGRLQSKFDISYEDFLYYN
jgi:5-methylcytosine-specific restriction protein A